MSTNYSAIAFYGYSLPRNELTRQQPNPLWGKVKFDPDTGDKVTQFIDEEVELNLEDGDKLRHMTRFTRFDAGYEDDHCILLGITLADMDLTYGSPGVHALKLLSDVECAKVQEEAKKLLDKAGIKFDPARVGYYLSGCVR